MSDAAFSPQEATPARPWWRSAEVGILLLLVVAGYFVRTGVIPIRGEEPRWAEVAREFVDSATWIVPREQGEVFLDRPPLHSWLLVATHWMSGRWDVWTLRLPSLVATLSTTLLVFAYGRTFLSRLGALAAAVAFATMGEMFQTGRLAETDALFILLLSASLLVWHWGWTAPWRPEATWSAGYGLMALATLTKGLQAPMYFVGTVGLYLLMTGAWRQLLRRAHWCGVGVGAVILSVWLLPLLNELGPSGVSTAFEKLSTYRLRWNWSLAGKHLLVFPVELFGCMAPWSLLLLLYAHRGFRSALAGVRPNVLFLTLGPLVALPTCWLHPGGNTRYFAPLYPLLALLMGLAVQRCAETEMASGLRRWWRGYLTTAAVAMVALAAVAGVQALGLARLAVLADVEPQLLGGYAFLFVAFGALAWWSRRGESPWENRGGLLAIAGFMVVACAGLLTDVRIRRAVDAEAAMAEIRARLPAGERLVSFNHIAPLFRYYYGEPIAPRPFPKAADDPFTGYFCYHWDWTEPPPLPFPWEEIGVVPLDRVRRESPRLYVVVGRRLPEASTAHAGQRYRATSSRRER